MSRTRGTAQPSKSKAHNRKDIHEERTNFLPQLVHRAHLMFQKFGPILHLVACHQLADIITFFRVN